MNGPVANRQEPAKEPPATRLRTLADCKAQDEFGIPLIAAARGDHEEVVELLLAHPGIDVNTILSL